jgi:hypothetical protein
MSTIIGVKECRSARLDDRVMERMITNLKSKYTAEKEIGIPIFEDDDSILRREIADAMDSEDFMNVEERSLLQVSPIEGEYNG